MGYVQATLQDIADSQRINQAIQKNGVFAPSTLALVGPPGTAKTQWSKTVFPEIVAEARGLDLSEVEVITRQPGPRDHQEFNGVGVPQKRERDGALVTRFSLSSLSEEIENALLAGAKCVVLVIDEFTACNDDQQKLFAPLVDKFEKRLGEYVFGPELVVVLTGNRSKDKAGSKRMLAHVANRGAVFEVVPDHAAFAAYGEANEFHPLFTDIAKTVEGFIDESTPTEERQACTYRQIEQCSDFLKKAEELGLFTDTISPAIEMGLAAYIGQDAAATVRSYARQVVEGIPTAAEIFANPTGAKVPDSPASQQFAVNRAVAELANYGPSAGNDLFDYIARTAPDLQITLGVKVARASVRAGIYLNSALANAFMIKHHDLIELANLAGAFK
ncbi:MAG: hypothetical protein CMF29_01055 [Kiritimatiellaceae bacterium]|nr:hypothetical protein [Kiritimatiellaceae bacterium]